MEFLNHIASDYGSHLVLLAVLGIVASIFSNKLTPAQAFLTATLGLIIFRVIPVQQFLHAFSNTQVITIFILIFITVAIRMNVDVNAFFDRFFPQKDSQSLFIFKLSAIVAFFSSFLNNTPIVSMLANNVQQWAKKKNIAPSKFLIPLSYAAMLGGMITVIGTSTNLVLMGLLSSNNEPLLSHIDFFVVGSVVALVGIVYLILFSNKLLPDRKIAIKHFAENLGEYIHEIELEADNSLIGKTVLDAGLKNLHGIYLIEIARAGQVITPVSPDVVINEGDHFYLAGDTELVIEFVRDKKGLMLSSEAKLQKVGDGNIVEVVISANSKLTGVQVKSSNFREDYNASIIGIHRNGEKISGKIGYVKLKSGDLMLLLTGNDFENRISGDKNLYLLSQINKSFDKPVISGRYFYWILQIFTLAAVLTHFVTPFLGLLLSLFLLVSFKYLSIDSIKRSFNFDLLIVLACSLAMGKAFIDTGAADIISDWFLQMTSTNDLKLVLTSLFLFTAVLTSLVTNIAAVSIAFPVAFALAHQLNLPGPPFYLTIAFAASAAFITPMAYQTNMMVFGPGGYKSIDFLKMGLPLLLIYMITSLLMIFWWFEL